MKKLVVFMFSIVLLGSCSKEGCTDPLSNNYDEKATEDDGSCDIQRTVKFVIERNTTPNQIINNYCSNIGIPNQPIGSAYGRLTYSYISGDGVSQSQGEVESNWYSPDHPSASPNWVNTSIEESSEITMLKSDNVEIYYRVGTQCANGESYTFKAIINDENEYVIAQDVEITSSNSPSSNNNFSVYTAETINWIVP